MTTYTKLELPSSIPTHKDILEKAAVLTKYNKILFESHEQKFQDSNGKIFGFKDIPVDWHEAVRHYKNFSELSNMYPDGVRPPDAFEAGRNSVMEYQELTEEPLK